MYKKTLSGSIVPHPGPWHCVLACRCQVAARAVRVRLGGRLRAAVPHRLLPAGAEKGEAAPVNGQGLIAAQSGVMKARSSGRSLSLEVPFLLPQLPFSCTAAIVIVSVSSLVEFEQAIYLWRVRRRGIGRSPFGGESASAEVYSVRESVHGGLYAVLVPTRPQRHGLGGVPTAGEDLAMKLRKARTVLSVRSC